MRAYLMGIFCCIGSAWGQAQSIVDSGQVSEANLEQTAESNLRTVEEDRFGVLGRRRMGLNEATEEWLASTGLLSVQQVQDFLLYRQTFGAFIHIHELQAIPSWDRTTLESMVPLVQLDDGWPSMSQWWKNRTLSSSQYTVRVGRRWQFEQNEGSGWLLTKDNYRGSPWRLWQSFQTRFQSGIDIKWQMEKDAGEKWQWGAGQRGFDFYGGFVRLPATRHLETLILGDFQVNFGQGLVQWQSFAAQKGMDPVASYRQAMPIRAHQGSAESGFYRGVGATARWGPLRLTSFISRRPVSASLTSLDSSQVAMTTRIRAEGLHRTASEWSGRRKVSVGVFGQSAQWRMRGGTIGAHWVVTKWDKSWQQPEAWYQRFEIQQKTWLNGGIDFKWTWKQWFVFGEYARDQGAGHAGLLGVWFSMAKGSSLHILIRQFGKTYRAPEAQVFGEKGNPWNEKGVYIGLQLKPRAGLTGSFNFDLYAIPWLQYRVHRSTSGQTVAMRWVWTLNKRQQFDWQWKWKAGWYAGDMPLVMPTLVHRIQHSFRIHYHHVAAPGQQYNLRLEWQTGQSGGASSAGYQWFLDHVRQQVWKQIDVSARIYYVMQPHYNLRFYSLERSAFPGGSLQALYGQGLRASIQLERNWSGKAFRFRSKNLSMNAVGSISVQLLNKDIAGDASNEDPQGKSIEGRIQLIFRLIH